MYYIGIDLGTTGCKSIVFDDVGKMLGEAYIEYPLIVLSESFIEQDACMWSDLSLEAVRIALERAQIDKKMVKALSISSQGISFVLVDKALNPICNAISWLDSRAVESVDRILDVFDEDYLFNITGKKINAAYVLPKIMWLKKYKNEIWENSYKLLMAHDYIVSIFTGGLCITDHTMASGTMLYDITGKCWSNEILEKLDIEIDKLPVIENSGTIAGKIDRGIAELLGLPSDTAIVVGGQDQKVAAYGANIDKDTATLSLGTAGSMQFILDEPIFDKEKRLPCFSFITQNTWSLESVISTSGVCLKLLRNTFYEDKTYQQLDELCEQSCVGANGIMIYPHMAGATSPHWNSLVKGSIHGLTLNTTQADIVRGVMEGITFEIKENLDVFEKISGVCISCIKVFGGGANSNIWCRIIADITNKKTIVYKSPEVVNFGAAKIAYWAINKNTHKFDSGFLNKLNVYFPNSQNCEKYKEIYKKYLELERKIL
jgi:sugar (pentulose or hexulose) kinase